MAVAPLQTGTEPSYYSWTAVTQRYGVPLWELIAEFPHFRGAALKYIIRAGRKTPDPIQDLEKAIDCLQKEIARLRDLPAPPRHWEVTNAR